MTSSRKKTIPTMTNRKRVLAVLHGDKPDRIPFTIYGWKIPWGYDKRKLCERGLTLMRRFSGWRAEYPHCALQTISYQEQGCRYEREIVKTPVGEINALFATDPADDIRRRKEFWIRTSADYEPMLFMIRDTVLRPAYDEIKKAQYDLGEDGVAYIFAGYSPLQEIIINLLGIEPFCYELADHPQQVWALYEALRDRDRRLYPILADAPAEIVQYCANPIASVLGRALFTEKIIPCLNECGDLLHAQDKLQSIHVDGDNAIWADALAASSVDIIEAFTPAPGSDMTMHAGRQAFADKIIWCNFPSAVHLASADQIRLTTRRILRDAAPGNRFIMGITEDLPDRCWRTSLNAILDVLETEGRCS